MKINKRSSLGILIIFTLVVGCIMFGVLDYSESDAENEPRSLRRELRTHTHASDDRAIDGQATSREAAAGSETIGETVAGPLAGPGTSGETVRSPNVTPRLPAQPNTPKPSLSSAFAAKLDKIESLEKPYFSRRNAVAALPLNLNPGEIKALYDFLLSPPPETESERRRDRALKNNVLNKLRNQTPEPSDLTHVMIQMFQDIDQDLAVRDYALQHLAAWYPKASTEDRTAILKTSAKALQEVDSSLGGTALLSLYTLQNKFALSPAMDVIQAAHQIAASSRASELSRVTALQILAKSGSPHALEIARQWAMDSNASYSERASAIAALGTLDSEEAEQILLWASAQKDEHLESAIQQAIQMLY